MKTIDEMLEGCEHDGSYIPVSEVKRLMEEYAAMIFSEKVDETYQASQSPEPNTVTEKQIREVFEKFEHHFEYDSAGGSESFVNKYEALKWALQQTQAVTELTYVECSERQATHYIIKEPGDSACYPVKLLNQKK